MIAVAAITKNGNPVPLGAIDPAQAYGMTKKNSVRVMKTPGQQNIGHLSHKILILY